MHEHSGAVEAEALLDVGTGTARRLAEAAPRVATAVGVDLVIEMLAAGRAVDPSRGPLVVADARALPFTAGSFDLIWCRLVLGHLANLEPAYAELRRVARPPARLVVTDFHPEAVAAGHTRSFRDAGGIVRTVEHHVHGAGSHAAVATRAGWRLDRVVDVTPSDEERPMYEAAGRLDQFEREAELPLVLLVCLHA